MIDFNNPDIQEFAIEAKELLDSAETELLNAETGQSATFYDSVFRAFHSIKGGAGILGLPDLQSHMHAIESQWSTLKGKAKLEKHESEYFLAALDVGKMLLQGSQVTFDYNKFSSPSTPTAPKPDSVQAPNNQNNKKATPPSHEKVIYAIDDENDILIVLKDILEQNGFMVRCFLDADECFTACKSQAPQVILTDFKMPKKSGLDVLRFIHKNYPETPVIILSAHLSKEILVESLKNGGFFAALEKPFDEIDLIKNCWTAIKHHELQRMLKKSINLLMYQFSDLEKYLTSQGKQDIANTIGKELKELIAMRKEISKSVSA